MVQRFTQVLRLRPVTILPPMLYEFMPFMYLVHNIMLAVDTFIRKKTLLSLS